MKSQKKENGAGHAFRLVPHSKGKALVGVAAMVAVSSFAFLVFGPVADRRALEMAGHFAVPAAAEARGQSQPMPAERWAGAAPREFQEAH